MVNIGTKGGIQNQVLFYERGNKKFPNEQVEKYFKNELKLSKDDNYKVGYLASYNKGKFNYYVVVKIRNYKKINDYIEDIVGEVSAIIRSLDKRFFIDLDRSGFTTEEKHIIEELFILSMYDFSECKSEFKKNYDVVIKDKTRQQEDLEAVGKALNFSSDLINYPENYLNPDTYEDIIKEYFKKRKNVKIKVFDSKKLYDLGMNGIYNVGKSSSRPPRLVLIEYKPKSGGFNYGIVGKGVCFDTGGYNLKPGGGPLENMSGDMGGSAVAMGVLDYISSNNFNENVVFGIPIVSNDISSTAYKPYNILTMYNGTTVNVGNTDAEGRLIMADTLSYLEEKYDPKYMFDVATLTGAQVVALGPRIGAIMGPNSKLNKKFQDLSWQIKERFWELPFLTKYLVHNKSQKADLNSIGDYGGMGPGCITAGLFLSNFVKNKNWMHLDIAGPANILAKGQKNLYNDYTVGFGVRTMIRFLQR